MAECFFLDIDEQMCDRYNYARYVDDIRILGDSRIEVQRGIAELDIFCKEIGLIPNRGKFGIRKLRNRKELLEGMPNLLGYQESRKKGELTEMEAIDLLDESVLEKPDRIADKSKFRYMLFRAPRSRRILYAVARLWPKYPEHTDAYVAYLESFERSALIVNLCKKQIDQNYPYDFVIGEMWKLLARMSNPDEMRMASQQAIDTVKAKGNRIASRVGALSFLCACETHGLGSFSRWAQYESNPIAQSLISPYLDLRKSGARATAKRMLRRSTPDAGLSLMRSFLSSRKKPIDLGVTNSEMNVVVQNSLFGVGLVENRSRPRPNPIAQLLKSRHNLPVWQNWLPLLGAEYQSAHESIVLANSSFLSYPTGWLGIIDGFCEIILRAFVQQLNLKNVPGAISLVNKNADPLDYGTILKSKPKLEMAYPVLIDRFKQLHDRRNSLPTSHPLIRRTGIKSKPLKGKEKARMARLFREGIIEITRAFDALP
ncbi:MAG: hypothetical protein WD740_03330 [Anaerolineales bacterium]